MWVVLRPIRIRSLVKILGQLLGKLGLDLFNCTYCPCLWVGRTPIGLSIYDHLALTNVKGTRLLCGKTESLETNDSFFAGLCQILHSIRVGLTVISYYKLEFLVMFFFFLFVHFIRQEAQLLMKWNLVKAIQKRGIFWFLSNLYAS